MSQPVHRDTIYLDGAWVPATSGRTIEVVDPTTEQVCTVVPEASDADVDRAVGAARAAFDGWAATPVADRVAILRALKAELEARRTEIAAAVTTEMGCPRGVAEKIQATLPPVVVGTYADLLEGPDGFAFETTQGHHLVRREAAGVVAAITPWNYPLHQITNKLAPALAAGCTVVLKPSEETPTVAYLLMEACEAAGVPAGVVNLVPGYGPGVGEALVSHPDVDVVSFTGSPQAGRRVAELAARSIARVCLELGGKSANVVLDDADLETAVKVGVSNAFLNGGQTCTAWTRLVVPAERYDEAVELAAGFAGRFVPGDPTEEGTRLGPMVNARQRDRIRGLIEVALAEGARVVVGGPEAPDGMDVGYYVRPTVLADVEPDSTVAQTEVFGPVLSVLAHTGDDDAVAIANNSPYGLHGAVWSADPERARSVARRMRTGQVDINGAAFSPTAPFGGYKHSGIGRELGAAGLEEYLEVKAIGLP